MLCCLTKLFFFYVHVIKHVRLWSSMHVFSLFLMYSFSCFFWLHWFHPRPPWLTWILLGSLLGRCLSHFLQAKRDTLLVCFQNASAICFGGRSAMSDLRGWTEWCAALGSWNMQKKRILLRNNQSLNYSFTFQKKLETKSDLAKLLSSRYICISPKLPLCVCALWWGSDTGKSWKKRTI